MSTEYGWTPRQIAALTPAQACAYLSTICDGVLNHTGVEWMSPAAAAEFTNARRAARNKWIDDQLRRLTDDPAFDS